MIAMTLAIFVTAPLGLTACNQPTPTTPTSENAAPSTSDSTPALTNAIHGIDAAIYGYGIVGAHLAGSEQKKANRAIATLSRQRLTFMLALGNQINATAVAYQLPFPVTDSATAKKLAALLEVKLIPLFNAAVSATTGPVNIAAQMAAAKATARAAAWAGASTTPAPEVNATN
jgi:hypothetical protein